MLWKITTAVLLKVKFMSNKNPADTSSSDHRITRRELVASGAAIAAASLSLSSNDVRAGTYRSKKPANGAIKAPFDSLRDYVDALDQHGLLQRFSGVDQDKFEATAIIYQLIDQYGVHGAPAVWFDNIKAQVGNRT